MMKTFINYVERCGHQVFGPYGDSRQQQVHVYHQSAILRASNSMLRHVAQGHFHPLTVSTQKNGGTKIGHRSSGRRRGQRRES